MDLFQLLPSELFEMEILPRLQAADVLRLHATNKNMRAKTRSALPQKHDILASILTRLVQRISSTKTVDDFPHNDVTVIFTHFLQDGRSRVALRYYSHNNSAHVVVTNHGGHNQYMEEIPNVHSFTGFNDPAALSKALKRMFHVSREVKRLISSTSLGHTLSHVRICYQVDDYYKGILNPRVQLLPLPEERLPEWIGPVEIKPLFYSE